MLIDTHIHFGGSIPTETVWEIIQEKHQDLSSSHEEVRENMIYDGTGGFNGFLDKFLILDEIRWNEELLHRSIKAVANNLKNDFTWLDFSINKYLRYMDMEQHELIKFFHDTFQKYCPNKIALVLSIKYESLDASKRHYIDLIHDDRASKYLAGIDLVGDESKFQVNDFLSLRDWHDAGKMVRLHVGEMGYENHVVQALKNLKITNIAHGIDIIDDEDAYKMARDMGIQFDLALTSNLKIRQYKDMTEHPIYQMHNLGLKLTLGSDDPVVFQTDLSHEYDLVDDKNIVDHCVNNSIEFCRKYGYFP
jgi:adenosine deaminase